MNAKRAKAAAADVEVRDDPGLDADPGRLAEEEAGGTAAELTTAVPHSPDAEKGLLGSLLSDRSSWDKIEGLVLAEEFYSPAHRHIFAAMEAAARQHKLVDPLTVHDQLDSRGLAPSVGGVDYLLQLAESPLNLGEIEVYAHLIRESAICRQLIRAGRDFVSQSLNRGGKSAKELLDEAEGRIFQLGGRLEVGKGFRLVSDVREDVLQRIQELCDAGSDISGLATGFSQLDHLTSGLQKSDMVVIAARPSMGKTSLALNIAQNVALGSNKGKVAIFSLEMSAEQLVMRMLASLGRVDLSHLSKGRLRDKQWASINSAVSLLGGASIYVDESPTLSVLDVRRRLRQIMRRADGLDLVILDYLQMLTGDGSKRRQERFQEITEISRELKSLAREFGLPVIVLAQLNRDLEKREAKRPRLSDLRDSGAIEQDADLIVFIYRDEYYREDSEEKGVAELIIGKHRNGPTGTIKLNYHQEYTLFESPAGDHPADFGGNYVDRPQHEAVDVGEMP